MQLLRARSSQPPTPAAAAAAAAVARAGLQSLRRQLSGRPRPAADELLCGLLAASPDWQLLHGVWEAQASARDTPTSLELQSCCAALLRYTPSARAAVSQRAALTGGLDALALSLLRRRLRQLYFALSSGSRPRANGALSLLAALAGRGGQVLRELVAAFDFGHSALPKLARPPRAAAADGGGGAAAAAADEPAAAAAAVAAAAGGAEVPAHWESWHSPALSRRPSRALFLEWGERLQLH